MIQQVSPDEHGVALSAVEGAIHEFHLGHLPIQEELQLRQHQFEAPETHALIYGRKAVAAGKGAAAAGFVVDDAVFKVGQLLIGEGEGGEIHQGRRGIRLNLLHLPRFRFVVYITLV